ncbi:unnamed protein product [Cylindrotheca closterium]|uniref:Uncharacterized protein n=1 Tax=Cylindrotheca closterium TaxID=2856 RepID=A0AAD2CQ42_9STRA|nr:unnamed protein product [Cylindrotheca closterium]
MPTFESIPLHPVLKQRLLEPPNPGGVSISTPQALLSRTPQALADQILLTKSSKDGSKASNNIGDQATMKQIDTLRSQVAHVMMAQTRMGKYRLQQQQLYDDSTVQYDTKNGTEHYYATRPLVLGATVSAMQAWQQEQERKGPITNLSTGCRALDELLSLPAEYSNPHPYALQQEQNGQPQQHPHHSAMLGFPRGHLLSFSGHSGSGKSQWCLQLAAQALRQPWIQQFPTARVRYCYSGAGHDGNALAQRLSQLLQHQVSPMSPSSPFSSGALEKVEYQPIRTTTQLVAILQALEDELLEASSYGTRSTTTAGTTFPTHNANQGGGMILHHQPPFVLVVDSLSNLEVQGDPSQMSRLLRTLKRLARQYSLWVVVTLSEHHHKGNKNAPATNLPGDYHVLCQSMTVTAPPPTPETSAITTTTTIQATLWKHPAKLDQPSITLFHTPSGMSTRASPTM